MLAATLMLVVGGCAASGPSFSEDPSDYEEEVETLQARLEADPADGAALRDLGQIYLQTRRPNRAYDTLKRAYSHLPNDPKTLFYLGMATESVGRTNAALELFSQYDAVPEDTRYRDLMEGRYEWLVREQARTDIREMIARETELAGDDLSRGVLAVLPLNYRGAEAQYEPLGRGLAEMLITDLANVSDLRVVERVRLQAILNELEFGQTDYVDPASAPRVGRLLGAGRLAGGSYRVTQAEDIRMDMTVVELNSETAPRVPTQAGALADLFALQKELALALLDALDVSLTREERAAIAPVPTESLDAFLAFSKGLLDEDGGRFEAAAEHYRTAVAIDPGFSASARRAARAERLHAAGGAPQNALSTALSPAAAATSALLQQRLNNMGRGYFGINDLIDGGRRTPVEDVGGIPDTELPPPPAPPTRSPQ
ncbi:CsgG/HfaB family protein [Longimonas halophila]|uniref:CsgG/HfaB family protein n=1 Tax=Longimonas halophila TaxID=1469170 RepID=UPI0015966054|nr:CsgG/HfaB family protein [Longimonas halophila]